jgi:hypothetical protein
MAALQSSKLLNVVEMSSVTLGKANSSIMAVHCFVVTVIIQCVWGGGHFYLILQSPGSLKYW